MEIHVLELARWRQHPDFAIPAKLLGWMRFFAEAETWQEVPSDIDTPVLESAMAVLTDFQTNATRNDLYRARLDYLRVQNTIAVSMAQALADKEQALAREEQARAETAQALTREEQARAETAQALADKEQARAETAQALAQSAKFRERLRAAGIDPDGM